MRWSKVELLQAKDSTISFDEQIEFDEAAISKITHLRKLRDVTVSGDIHYDDSSKLVIANIEIEGIMILPCSITLEDVEHPFYTTSSEVYTFEKGNDNEDVHETKGDIVELYPIIFQMIVLEIPYKVVKAGISEYPKGKGWEVVKEEDIIAEKKAAIDPRLAKLRDFKIEE